MAGHTVAKMRVRDCHILALFAGAFSPLDFDSDELDDGAILKALREVMNSCAVSERSVSMPHRSWRTGQLEESPWLLHMKPEFERS